jgi:uncharacterized membrane protein YkoI
MKDMKKGMLIAVVVALIALAGCTPGNTGMTGAGTQNGMTGEHAQTGTTEQDTQAQKSEQEAQAQTTGQGTQPQPTGMQAQIPGSESWISEAEAKAIALNHAGLTEADVVFVRAHLDYDDGWCEYEVEFYSGNIEYDYEIDALSGEIRSYDHDAEYHVAPSMPAGSANSADIGKDKAQTIALGHAGYRADEVRRLRTERDFDDGRLEYEVEFFVGNIEYSYTIDAASGAVLEYEAEQDD